MTFYSRLVALYPDDVRFAYGDELVADLERRHAAGRGTGRLRHAAGVVARLSSLLTDIAMEWANCVYSHRSFHGRARPNSGVVRPPNMSKREWFNPEP
jgi:hypothetical protein